MPDDDNKMPSLASALNSDEERAILTKAMEEHKATLKQWSDIDAAVRRFIDLLYYQAKRIGPGKHIYVDTSEDRFFDKKEDKFINLLDFDGWYQRVAITIIGKPDPLDPENEIISLGPNVTQTAYYVGSLEKMAPAVFNLHRNVKVPCVRRWSNDFKEIMRKRNVPHLVRERKARSLLRSLLNKEQKQMYSKFGTFYVETERGIYWVCGYDGVKLLKEKHISFSENGTPLVVFPKELVRYCLHNVDWDMPQADVQITQKMLLEGKEDHFLAVANADLGKHHPDYDPDKDIFNYPIEQLEKIILERNGGVKSPYEMRETHARGYVLHSKEIVETTELTVDNFACR